MWNMHNERNKDGWLTLALVCVLLNLLSTEVIWMSPVLPWLLTRNQFEARGQDCGVMGRSSCWWNYREVESIAGSALEQTQVGWWKKAWSQGGQPMTEWPARLIAHSLYLPLSSLSKFSTLFYNENKHMLSTYYVPASVPAEPDPTKQKVLTWNYIKRPFLFVSKIIS